MGARNRVVTGHEGPLGTLSRRGAGPGLGELCAGGAGLTWGAWRGVAGLAGLQDWAGDMEGAQMFPKEGAECGLGDRELQGAPEEGGGVHGVKGCCRGRVGGTQDLRSEDRADSGHGCLQTGPPSRAPHACGQETRPGETRAPWVYSGGFQILPRAWRGPRAAEQLTRSPRQAPHWPAVTSPLCQHQGVDSFPPGFMERDQTGPGLHPRPPNAHTGPLFWGLGAQAPQGSTGLPVPPSAPQTLALPTRERGGCGLASTSSSLCPERPLRQASGPAWRSGLQWVPSNTA